MPRPFSSSHHVGGHLPTYETDLALSNNSYWLSLCQRFLLMCQYSFGPEEENDLTHLQITIVMDVIGV